MQKKPYLRAKNLTYLQKNLVHVGNEKSKTLLTYVKKTLVTGETNVIRISLNWEVFSTLRIVSRSSDGVRRVGSIVVPILQLRIPWKYII